METKIEKYDKKEQYEQAIQPLVRELVSKCYVAGIPCFFAAAIKEDESTEYSNEMVSAAVLGKKLSDDRIARFVNVIRGYDVIPPGDAVDTDDLSFKDELHSTHSE